MTGKSTIISHFINQSGLMDVTAFATFTGKASLVLQNKGLPATTIHKLIYNAYRNKVTGNFYFKLKPILDRKIKLIVIDEVSMVPMQLLTDLMSFNIPLVCLGDPGQLEPIGEDNGLLKNPNIFLEEIHRQAQDNSIIKLSMMVRQGEKLPVITDDPFVKVLKKEDLTLPMLQWADQILCSKNITRRTINHEMRQAMGFTDPLPEKGDKLICLHNYWDFLNDDGFPLINGTVGKVTDIVKGKDSGILPQQCFIDFQAVYTEPEFYSINADPNIFKGIAPQKNLLKNKRIIHEFDYGYAITIHKSQGSSFEKVLIYEEYLKGAGHARLLYTAITRASEKLVLIKAD